MELDNMWVAHALKHLQLVVNHLLVAAHVLLQDDLDRDLALRTVGLSHDAIRAGTQGPSKAIPSPAITTLSTVLVSRGSRGVLTFDRSCRADRAAC